MKVLLINSSYPPNAAAGAEAVVRTLASGLQSRGHEVVVVTTQPRGARTIGQVDEVRVHYVPVSNVYRPFNGGKPIGLSKAFFHIMDSYNLIMMRKIGRIFDEERPDVVNVHNLAGFSTSVISGAAERRLPIVHTLHDQYLLCFRCTMFRDGRNCTRQCTECRICAVPRRSATDQVNAVIGVSRFILDRHIAAGYFRKAATRVVYNAVLTNEHVSPQVGRETRCLRFGFLGQLRATKGVHLLVDAFVSAQLSGTELWIAGKGDEAYELEVRGRVSQFCGIRWLGFVSPSELLSEVDVLVVPSLWKDTAQLVILEAYRFGIPVLGANRGGIPEFVHKETGWIFEPEDARDFRRALTRCCEERERLPKMGQAARSYAASFGLSRFLDGYIEAYAAASERRNGCGSYGPLAT